MSARVTLALGLPYLLVNRALNIVQNCPTHVGLDCNVNEKS